MFQKPDSGSIFSTSVLRIQNSVFMANKKTRLMRKEEEKNTSKNPRQHIYCRTSNQQPRCVWWPRKKLTWPGYRRLACWLAHGILIITFKPDDETQRYKRKEEEAINNNIILSYILCFTYHIIIHANMNKYTEILLNNSNH